MARLGLRQQFLLGLDGDEPIVARGVVRLHEGAVVEGEYASRVAKRNAGWLILGIGAPAGLATAAAGVGLAANNSGMNAAPGVGMIAGGALTFLVSTIVGLAFGLTDDEAHVHVR